MKKPKIIVSNKKAVITLEGEAFQLLMQIVKRARFMNLYKNILENTKVK